MHRTHAPLTPPTSTDAICDATIRRYRWHDPVIGRFTSFDSFEASPSDPLSLHKYNYGNANPISNVDPTGMFSVAEIGTGSFIAAVIILLTHPNVANAPGPDDAIYADRGGDMALSSVISVPIGAGIQVAVRFVVSPAIKWASTQVTNLFSRRSGFLTTRLYRVVSEAEYAHMRQAGRMLPDPTGRGYQDGKWFWTTPSAAQKWADKNPQFYKDGYRVIAVDVPPELSATAHRQINLDQVGDAVFLELDDLISAAVKEAGL